MSGRMADLLALLFCLALVMGLPAVTVLEAKQDCARTHGTFEWEGATIWCRY